MKLKKIFDKKTIETLVNNEQAFIKQSLQSVFLSPDGRVEVNFDPRGLSKEEFKKKLLPVSRVFYAAGIIELQEKNPEYLVKLREDIQKYRSRADINLRCFGVYGTQLEKMVKLSKVARILSYLPTS